MHHLYCDNYYTSPDLFLTHKNLGFGACGTVWVNRRGVPACIKAKDMMLKVEVKSVSTDSVLALKWKDKRVMTILSTIHDDSNTMKRRWTRLSATGVEDCETYSDCWLQHIHGRCWRFRPTSKLLHFNIEPPSGRNEQHSILSMWLMWMHGTTPSAGCKLTHTMFLVEIARGFASAGWHNQGWTGIFWGSDVRSSWKFSGATTPNWEAFQGTIATMQQWSHPTMGLYCTQQQKGREKSNHHT